MDLVDDSSTDEELMHAYGKGDLKAFERLVKRHERAVFGYLLRSCSRRDVAEELLQEVFLRVVKGAKNYRSTAKFTTWLYTIARNICIDRARKQRHRKEQSLDAPLRAGEGDLSMLDRVSDTEASAGSSQIERKRFRQALESALDELPSDQREVFVMREITGLKFREIAEILECPVPTIKSRMRYALEGLRGHLETFRHHQFDADEKKEVSS